jgi:ABC-type phosphate transport system substrate-binding protein
MSKAFVLAIATGAALLLAGCATNSAGPDGDPGAKPLPPGATCQSLRAELNKMDSQGAQSKVERASKGKVDPATQGVADRYNQLLNQYLGARCHT